MSRHRARVPRLGAAAAALPPAQAQRRRADAPTSAASGRCGGVLARRQWRLA